MIEIGKEYDLKHIIIIDGDKETQAHEEDGKYKVLAIQDNIVLCKNTVSGETFTFMKSSFIDPDFPEDDKTYMHTVKNESVLHKLSKVMHPMNLSFWKDLQEEATCGSLGAAPCPAMGQITGGNISGCMVNGVPVEGKSRKKKKKAKNEELEAYIQSLIEDFNEEYEEITEQIAKYLDRLNFEFANTEEIIYKKEGENKYLFKFDNEIGVIKIKVLHNDEVLVEKEFEVDDTEDIQPIFDEIESIYKEYGL